MEQGTTDDLRILREQVHAYATQVTEGAQNSVKGLNSAELQAKYGHILAGVE